LDYAKHEVNRTDLHFIYEDGRIEDYFNQACLGALYGRTFENLHVITYPFGSIPSPTFRLDPVVSNFYIDFLQEQGFQGFDYHQFVAYPSQHPFCYAEWVSTFTALRYTYEPNSRVVKWWFDKVYHRPELNKWVVFVMGHLDAALGHGHTLIHNTVHQVVSPMAVLAHLRTMHTAIVGWGKTRGSMGRWSNVPLSRNIG
jgi:hypothetical protein